MTSAEYSKLFHRAEVNLVAFKQVNHCDNELRRMIEMAIAEEREACAKVCDDRAEAWLKAGFWGANDDCIESAKLIRQRGKA